MLEVPKVRKERLSAMHALLLTLLLPAAVFFHAAVKALEVVRSLRWSSGRPALSQMPFVFDLACLTVYLIVTIFASRLLYKKLRWKMVYDDGLLCLNCDYDLTGNESGICPECGNKI